MGNPKQKWTAEEEEALRAGVAKHGAGKWKNIQNDPEFNQLLSARSNIDLKDKWRNLSVASGQGSRDTSKTPTAKTDSADTPATPLQAGQSSASVTPGSQDASKYVPTSDASRSLPEGNTAAQYNAMIYDALSRLKEPNGSDSGAIANYIEQRHEVPQNFKRMLSCRLRRLVRQGKLEKIDNCYRIKKDAPPDAEPGVQTSTSTGYVGGTIEEASISAAHRVALAEDRSFMAAESGKQKDIVSAMVDEASSLLQFAIDCYDQSAGGGQVLLMA